VTRVLKAHGALSVWDYAGGGPYLSIDMGTGTDAEKDAVVVSPHKFPGGPGASGVLILRNSAVRASKPSWPGGGTVAFVSPWSHEYSQDISTREEAGTPNVVGDIRAALVFLVKEAVGLEVIARREHELNQLALAGWQDNPALTLLGVESDQRLPIFSFLVQNEQGQPISNCLLVCSVISTEYKQGEAVPVRGLMHIVCWGLTTRPLMRCTTRFVPERKCSSPGGCD